MHSENLWAPWRMPYIQRFTSETSKESSGEGGEHGCFLCEAAKVPFPGEAARDRLVLAREDHGLIMLNLYPYTNGHLLVAPAEHVADLTDLSAQGRGGLMELTALAERLLRTAINPQGINIGINLGRCAGAGLPGHLHVHLVPRWSGDTNFMQTVGHVRVIPEAIQASYERLAGALQAL